MRKSKEYSSFMKMLRVFSKYQKSYKFDSKQLFKFSKKSLGKKPSGQDNLNASIKANIKFAELKTLELKLTGKKAGGQIDFSILW